jgi:hypothetical protein
MKSKTKWKLVLTVEQEIASTYSEFSILQRTGAEYSILLIN